jgi:hypothetical protein
MLLLLVIQRQANTLLLLLLLLRLTACKSAVGTVVGVHDRKPPREPAVDFCQRNGDSRVAVDRPNRRLGLAGRVVSWWRGKLEVVGWALGAICSQPTVCVCVNASELKH